MMKLEEAVKELKNIWKETDFENSKRRIAIETVLKKLEKLQKETIPKKKIEDKIKEYFENIKLILKMVEKILLLNIIKQKHYKNYWRKNKW